MTCTTALRAALLCVATLPVVATAQANVLPPVSVALEVVIPATNRPTLPDRTTFGTLEDQALIPGLADETALARSEGRDSVLAVVHSQGGLIGGGFSARATVIYYFEILGPDGMVPVNITGSGAVSVPTPDGAAGAALEIFGSKAGTGVIDLLGCAGTAALGCGFTPFWPDSFDVAGTYDVPANVPIRVTLYANATQGDTAPLVQTSAGVDPTFSLNPSISGYSLIFSPDPVDVTPAPEPTSFALLGVGLFELGFIRHRKRGHRACF
jgi:hypothetical protein